MWSDRMPEAERASLAGRLRALLPAPRARCRASKTPLRTRKGKPPDPEQVAEELRGEPGFAWLDGGAAPRSASRRAGHRLYVRPLATLAVRQGRATVDGPGGSDSFAAGGFDLLAAAFDAWGDAAAGATLVGYLGYELGGELEALPPPPADDLGLPDLHLALYDQALLRDGAGWTLETTDAWRELAGRDRSDPVLAAERVLAAAGRRALLRRKSRQFSR